MLRSRFVGFVLFAFAAVAAYGDVVWPTAQIGTFDCLPACASDKDGHTSVAFSETDSTLFWMQKDEVKPGAEVLLSCCGKPLLVKGAYGKGRVFAFLAAPLGDEARDGKAFWTNPAYLKLIHDKLENR